MQVIKYYLLKRGEGGGGGEHLLEQGHLLDLLR